MNSLMSSARLAACCAGKMSRPLLILVALWFTASVAASGAEQAKDAVTVPERVSVPVGGTGYLTVKVDREQLPGKVRIGIENLPEGVSITDKEPVKTLQEKSEAEAMFTLLATADVQPGDHPDVQVVIASDARQHRESVTLDVRNYRLHAAGWIVMVISVAAVLFLVGFCMYRVLTLPPVEEETLRGPLDIDTGDTKNAD